MAKKSNKPNFKVNKIREFIFKNNLYNIVWKNKRFPGNHFAECDSPEELTARKEIRISPRALKDQKELLAVICDEVCHSFFWALDNQEVDMFSEGLSSFLWELGWRLPEKD